MKKNYVLLTLILYTLNCNSQIVNQLRYEDKIRINEAKIRSIIFLFLKHENYRKVVCSTINQ